MNRPAGSAVPGDTGTDRVRPAEERDRRRPRGAYDSADDADDNVGRARSREPEARHFGRRTWPELARRPLLAVPLGSTEQHGPHLPVDTDTRIARAVAQGLADAVPGMFVAPPFGYGASGEHAGFPGTLSIGTEALRFALVELVRSADDSAAGVVFVNGHGGNTAALRAAVDLLTQEGRRVLLWSPRPALATEAGVPDARGDLHAGRMETSLLLHLAPELVRAGPVPPGPSPALRDLMRHGVRELSPSGVLGDPAGATAAEGAALLARFVADAAEQVTAWAAVASHGSTSDQHLTT